jgi:hypothetical protein
MKQIQPLSIWYNGQIVQATILNMICINDNLTTSATFYYALFVDANFQVASGNIIMTNADYITFSTSTTANDYAYEWGATQLNLTLV